MSAKEQTIAAVLSELSGGRGHIRVQDAADAAYDAGYRAAREHAATLMQKRQVKVGWNVQQDLEAAAEIRKLEPTGS